MNNAETTIPSGMRQVTEDEFFALLRADPRDIMPSANLPYETWWKVQARGVIGERVGWTSHGWKTPYIAAPKVYAWSSQPPGVNDEAR